MHLTRQQFDVAVGGAYATVVVAATFISLRLAVPVAVVGGMLTGIAFALRDGADPDRKGASGDGR